MSFGPYNDGDAGLVRAVWSLIRHLRAEWVVETGVAHGFTSRFILQALASNRAGRLWSIDLPPLNPGLRQQVGIAVPKELTAAGRSDHRGRRRCKLGLPYFQ